MSEGTSGSGDEEPILVDTSRIISLRPEAHLHGGYLGLYGNLRTYTPTSPIYNLRTRRLWAVTGINVPFRFGLGKCIMHLTSLIWNDYGRVIYETEHNNVPSRTQAHEATVQKALGPDNG